MKYILFSECLEKRLQGKTMKDILPLIKSHLPDTVSKILKSDSSLYMEKVSPEEGCLGISYNLEGEIDGRITIFFDKAETIARRFLTITIGDEEAATTDESCHEVGNQILGLLFGSISNSGTEVRLSSFGDNLARAEADKCIEQGTYLASLTTGEYGNIHFYIILNSSLQETSAQTAAVKEENLKPPTRVMIVDDSPVMCAFLKKIFIEMNYDIVAIAEDGIEAIEKFKEYRPELVTLDIMMPKLKGTDVLKQIIAMSPETTVVMASSIADAKTVMNCLRIGAKRYIVKPYDKDAVVSAIEKALMIKKD